MLYLYLSIGINILTVIILGIILSKNNNKNTIIKELAKQINSLKSDFDCDKDFKYLYQMIQFEMNNCLDTEMVMITSQRGNELFKDKDLEEFTRTVALSSYKKLSENYKNKLILKYFDSNENLIKYITEHIYNLSTKFLSKINQDKINAIQRKNNASQIFEENKSNSKQKELVKKSDI